MSEQGDKLTYEVIGLAMQVHRKLGPGLDEVFYHELLSAKLKAAGVEHLFKPHGKLVHRGITVDEFEPDLVLPDRLVPELKTLWGAFAPEHFVQLTSYLKFWRIQTGLLIDFAKESLIHKRFVFSDEEPPPVSAGELIQQAPSLAKAHPLLTPLCESLARIYAAYRLGYRDTTYRGLLDADLRAEGVGSGNQPIAAICCDGERLGEAKLNCLLVEHHCPVMVLSLRDEIRAADRATLLTWLKYLDLPWGLIVNFGKRTLGTRFVIHPRTR